MAVIDLKYRFVFRKSWWMFVLFLFCIIAANQSDLSNATIIVLVSFPLAYTVLHESQYQLVINNHEGLIRVNYIFYKQAIQDFALKDVQKVEIKQLPNRYYGVYLFLKDAEILLDYRPTLDKAEEVKSQISQALGS